MIDNYVSSWSKSASRIHDTGLYDRNLERYPLDGMNVLQLGIGPGLETEKIWMKNPKSLVGVDIDSHMLEVAETYLTLQGHQVNATYNSLPSFMDKITGNNVLNNPDFDINEEFINLAIADYTDFTTFDTALSEFFDIAFLTFVGGGNGYTIQNTYSLYDALGTTDFLLKPGGRFIYIERVFCKNPEDIIKSITTPIGYNLAFFNFNANQKDVESAFYGNKCINISVNGIPNEINVEDSVEDGVLVNNMCAVLKEYLDVNAGILTMEFVKE